MPGQGTLAHPCLPRLGEVDKPGSYGQDGVSVMSLEIIGPHPFALNEQGKQKTRIGTIFPQYRCLYTDLPGVHAIQRHLFIERLNARRAAESLPPLTPEQEEEVAAKSVDLVIEPGRILIRPDPEHMDLAFAADELLQGLVSKRQIRFLSVRDPRVREAIKWRGEYWRISSIPKDRATKYKMVLQSKVAINGQPIYYYNQLTGTRWLTVQDFESLGALGDRELAAHLQEIGAYAGRNNRLGRPELVFFGAEPSRFNEGHFAVNFQNLPPVQLRGKYEELKTLFRAAVPEALGSESDQNMAWCERMLEAVFFEGNESQTEEVLSDLSPEFYLQIEWRPGGRFEEGEFLFDSVFDEAADDPDNPELQWLCDLRAKGIIFNFIREHGDIEYINVGCIRESLSRKRPQKQGRRGVYIAEFKSRSEPTPRRRLLRLLKWGVWEHLDEGKDLLQAIQDSDEYTDYWLDRRLGCRQLGMNLNRRVLMRRLSEVYRGSNAAYRGREIRTTYFEREFLRGIATDKLPERKLTNSLYATRFARVLGGAAASSLIVGRSLDGGITPVFDDGDELVCEDTLGLPSQILVADHSGAFGEYEQPLTNFAAYYASPVNSRAHVVPSPKAFAEAYLGSFRDKFLRIQADYRKRRRAFDTLFKHCKYDPAGSFAFRWERVLSRLDKTNVDELVCAIREHIRLPAEPPRSQAEMAAADPAPAPA